MTTLNALARSSRAPRDVAAIRILKPVIYARISQDRTGAGVKVAAQVADGKELCGRLGLPEPAVLSDNDLSAYSGKPRPGYDKLLAGLKSGEYNVLIVWHVDRLYRDMRDLENIVDAVVASGTTVHCVRGGEINLSTPEGQMQARMFGVLSRYESAHRADRVTNGANGTKARARAGRDHGGSRRYGFACSCAGPHDILKVAEDGTETVRRHEHLTADEIAAEARIVADLTQRVVDGESIKSLARELRERGMPTVVGGTWNARYVKELIMRPRNVGLRVHQGAVMYDESGQPVRGNWEPIVDRDLWDAACAVLTRPERGTWHGNAPKYELSGIAQCWCGGGIRGSAGDRYVGKTCNHIKRLREEVDAVVDAYIVGYLRHHGVQPATGPTADYRTDIATVQRLVDDHEDALAGNPPPNLVNVSVAGLQRNLARHQARLVDLEAQQALLSVPEALDGVTAESWPALPLDRRRAVIRELVTVTLLPAQRRHDPAAVEVLPRQDNANTDAA